VAFGHICQQEYGQDSGCILQIPLALFTTMTRSQIKSCVNRSVKKWTSLLTRLATAISKGPALFPVGKVATQTLHHQPSY
jgi:hypothetical protein